MKKTTPHPAQPTPAAHDFSRWAGWAVALGSFGVFVGSIVYALSPVEAALPVPQPIWANALRATVAGSPRLQLAGSIGVVSDVILAAGTALFAAATARHAVERLGWALLTLSVIIFVFVDVLAAGVLPRMAALTGADSVYAGFKALFDTLFVAGTFTFGLGALATLLPDRRTTARFLPKPLRWLGIAAGVLALISTTLYLLQVAVPQMIGASIALGTLIFAFYGAQLARHAHAA